tara:strand:- start:117 stop:815 length:699 start_codon:yes stop_codon:yes gene_type:complete
MIFKKNKIIFYTIKNSFFSYTLEELKETFSMMPANLPEYWKKIPNKVTNNKIWYQGHRNIKTCSGFINLFKRSMVFRLPFDLHIIFDDKGIVQAHVGTTDVKLTNNFLHLHQNFQFLDFIDQPQYKFILKIRPQIFMDSNVPLLCHANTYEFNGCEILPGIISDAYKEELNFFMPILKACKEIHIKKGTPLFMITPLNDQKLSVKFEERELNNKFGKTFSNFKKFVMKEGIK